MATYNGERFVAEQLASFTAQTRQPDEVVISDDGSTDRTVEIVEAWAADAPFDVKILRNDHGGFAANFGRALAATNGDLVFISDQDDVWMPSKIERVVAAADATPSASLFIHDLELVGPNLEPSGQTMLDRLARLGYDERAHIKGCCTAVRRGALDAALPIPDGETHDNHIHVFGGERLLIRELLLRYRIHDTNTSGWEANALTTINRRYLAERWLRFQLRRIRRRIRAISGR